jgi:ABC-2 type transport system ATP-binding protein
MASVADPRGPAIEMSGVSVRAGRVRLLDDVDLTVPRGALYALVGASGAGKTTTIKTLLGLVRGHTGRCTVLGESSCHIERLGGRVGAMLDTLALEPALTVRQNLHLFNLRYGVPPGPWDDLLEAFELEHLARRRVAHLSQGERQRLALVQALGLEPELLVLDEPLVHLDPLSVARVMERLVALQKERGVSVLVSSHHLVEVERSSTHLAFLHRGRVLQAGAAADLLRASHDEVEVIGGPAASLRARLEALSIVASVDERAHPAADGEACFRVRLDGATPAELNAALHAAGLSVHQLAPLRPSLEEMFRRSLSGAEASL